MKRIPLGFFSLALPLPLSLSLSLDICNKIYESTYDVMTINVKNASDLDGDDDDERKGE